MHNFDISKKDSASSNKKTELDKFYKEERLKRKQDLDIHSL